MAVVTELEVPGFDYLDPTVTGPRFHDVMSDLRERSWIARADPVGWLARFGLTAEIVEEDRPLPEAA